MCDCARIFQFITSRLVGPPVYIYKGACSSVLLQAIGRVLNSIQAASLLSWWLSGLWQAEGISELASKPTSPRNIEVDSRNGCTYSQSTSMFLGVSPQNLTECRNGHNI